MGPGRLERGFAVVAGSVLLVLGVLGIVGSPIVGRPDETALLVTGFGHDLLHLVSGALLLHVGIVLRGRQRAVGLIVLGVAFLGSGLLSLLLPDLAGLYDAPTSGLDQLGHLLLGSAAIAVGWMGRGVERREFGRAASRPIRG